MLQSSSGLEEALYKYPEWMNEWQKKEVIHFNFLNAYLITIEVWVTANYRVNSAYDLTIDL